MAEQQASQQPSAAGPRVVQEHSETRVRLRCPHCHSTGTCKEGGGGSGCEACFAYYSVAPVSAEGQRERGIACMVCKGRGSFEPTSLKIQNRLVPGLTILFVLVALSLIFYFADGEKQKHFDKVLMFAGTLTGSITGYYFGGERR